jgi:acyl-CoA synthetase (AMP-forming)/AMP-acid ligase II
MRPRNRIVGAGFTGTWAELPALDLPPVAAVLAEDHITALRAVRSFAAASQDHELLVVVAARVDDEMRTALSADGFALVTGGGTTPADSPRDLVSGRVWLLTSGTTGRPSRVAHDLNSLTTVRGDQPPRRWLCAYTPGSYAWWQIVTLALHHPNQGIVTVEPNQLATWPVVARDADVTAVSGTPTFWRQGLLRERAALAEASITQATLGGEPVDQAVLDAVADVLPEARISWIYASSEAGASIAVHDGRAGFPVEWLDRRNGPWVEDGELLLAPHHGGVEFRDRIATGDAVEVRDGRVHIVGRIDSDEINVGGAKISAAVVREVLVGHHDVLWAAVRGRRAPLVGTVVVAQLVLVDDAETEDAELLRWCRERLPEHAVPRRLTRLASIPIKESLKTDV